MTVDLEEWFTCHYFKNTLPPNKWDSLEMRAHYNTRRLLELFDKFNIKATFFVLGYVAERLPYLIEEVAAEGHEIGVHGYYHKLLTEITPYEFQEDLIMGLDTVKSITNQNILGFRAPLFTMRQNTLWALQIIKNIGLKYDSSIFPTNIHPDYGIGSSPMIPYKHDNGIFEVPLSSFKLVNMKVPFSGGGYFRLLPYRAYSRLVDKLHKLERPLIFYIHPWEIDDKFPVERISPVMRFRAYNNLGATWQKLVRLVSDYRFTNIRELYRDEIL